MEPTKLDYLFRVEAPWIYVGHGEPERKKWIPSYFYSREGMNVCTRQLRGKKMRHTMALMNEFGAALQFFEGFGDNWHALEECLMYMDEWLPADAYILVIERAEELLADGIPNARNFFLNTIKDVGDWWARPIYTNEPFNREAIPFHVLLHVSEDNSAWIEKIIRIAEEIDVPIRR